MNVKVVATNRKAKFEYFLLEQFEAGLSLHGSEIKSIRAGQISLAEAASLPTSSSTSGISARQMKMPATS